MKPHIPILETDRLLIRPLSETDLAAVHRAIDYEQGVETTPLAERRAWLEWSIRNYTALENLYQPPYGDRAIALRASGDLVGLVGLVPALGPFGQLPYFSTLVPPRLASRALPEVGLYWALLDEYRGRGYATEAARALIDFAFQHLNLARVVATTERSNLASQRVMQRLGMRLETNPLPQPEWFQVVGILENSGD